MDRGPDATLEVPCQEALAVRDPARDGLRVPRHPEDGGADVPALADEMRLTVEPLLEEVGPAGVRDPAVPGGAEHVPLQRRNPDVRNVVPRPLLCVDLGEHHVVDVPVDVYLDLELRLERLGEGRKVRRCLDAIEIDGPLLLRLADQCAPACRGIGRRRGRRAHLRDAARRRGGRGECGQDSQCCHDEDDRSEMRPEPDLGQRILLSTARCRV